ncbi:MAG: thioredoxin family protein [Candidatus Micrarchaeota archaeon]|nr:thioredoxin family protein [Candidatus Micrarchaeota archaeon]
MAPVYVEVLTSPNCPYSPKALKIAESVTRKKGEHVILREISVATSEGENIANDYNIEATPTIAINGRIAFVGVPSARVLGGLITEEFEREKRMVSAYF